MKQEQEENQIKELQKLVQTFNDTKQKDLTKRWMAMGITPLFTSIQTKYNEAVNSGHYPPDISKALECQ